MTDRPEITQELRPSRFRCIGLATACAVMGVVCFHLWFNGTDNAWVAGSFMVAGAVFFIFHLAPGAYALWLDSKGFSVAEMYTVKRYAWPEVTEFLVRRGFLGHYVEFQHIAPDTGEAHRVVLNETYGFKPVEMARLLNDRRKQTSAPKTGERRKVWRSRNC
ncbi:MAG: hypothetical protein GKS00_07455 [Alphaproteobacteria bacterium]|nr:hypothetical protein [Alphaproteobacteria bacterium]